jgi:hypothetical protein
MVVPGGSGVGRSAASSCNAGDMADMVGVWL